MLRVLVACEMSARVRVRFAARGWDAWSADILPDEAVMWNGSGADSMGRHYQGDVLDVIGQDWDLVIAHPPCDRLTQAGARYWRQWQEDGQMAEGAAFFMSMIERAGTSRVAVENPPGVMSLKKWGVFYREPDQVVQPSWFGDPKSKAICLWLHGGLPLLEADQIVTPTGRVACGGGSYRTDKRHGREPNNRVWEDSQGRARRKILRSLTSAGLARAMADQWGSFVEEGGVLPLAAHTGLNEAGT